MSDTEFDETQEVYIRKRDHGTEDRTSWYPHVFGSMWSVCRTEREASAIVTGLREVIAKARKPRDPVNAISGGDSDDVLDAVREALGADPKEGVVAAARRVKSLSRGAANVPPGDNYFDVVRGVLGASDDESASMASFRVIKERDAAIAKAKAAEEALADEVGKRVEAERRARGAEEEQQYEGARWSRVVNGDMAVLEKDRDEWKERAEKAERALEIADPRHLTHEGCALLVQLDRFINRESR